MPEPPERKLVIPSSELAEILEEDHRRTQWGNWRVNGSNWTLVHAETNYEIGLEEMNTSGEMLDWIIQISEKSWATPQDKSDLLDALNSIFGPQSSLCSCGGKSGSMPPKRSKRDTKASRFRPSNRNRSTIRRPKSRQLFAGFSSPSRSHQNSLPFASGASRFDRRAGPLGKSPGFRF